MSLIIYVNKGEYCAHLYAHLWYSMFYLVLELTLILWGIQLSGEIQNFKGGQKTYFRRDFFCFDGTKD